MSICCQCPRNCGVNRENRQGFCNSPEAFSVARVGLHAWEEPVLSGAKGAGAVFFAGCNLRCAYCQNRAISRGGAGDRMTADALAAAILGLQEQGAACIDLVTPTHYARQLEPVLRAVRPRLRIPVVYNCGGYESAETLRALDGSSLPHRVLAWAFAAVLLVSLATQPALHLARVRREADAAFAELRAAIGSAVDPESLYPGRPPVAEADDPVAALDPEAIEAEKASLQELRQMFERADGGTRRHPYQPDELAAAAAWFATHTSLVAAAEAMSEPGYRSCLPGPASFEETAVEGEFPYREPRVIEVFRVMNALTTRARLSMAAGDASAGSEALRRLENAAELVEDDALLIDYLLAASLRQMAFGLVSERIDLWSEEDLLALERAAAEAAAAAGDRLRTAIDWETCWLEKVFEGFARKYFGELSAATRGCGVPDWWLAAERRARYRDSAVSWKAADAILRAGPDAAVGEAIDRLREDEVARGASLPPLSRMVSFTLAGMLDTVVATWDHASFVRAAVAVERYRRAHGGALPPSLDALVPEYLPAVPRAARTGAPLVYEPGPLDIPEETVSALRDPDEAAAESDAEFRARFGDADKITVDQIVEAVNDGAFPDKPEPEPRVLPAQTLPGFRLVLPARRARDEDVSRDFFLGPATPSPAGDEPHAESAESESHAENAEDAEPKPHAESAESPEDRVSSRSEGGSGEAEPPPSVATPPAP